MSFRARWILALWFAVLSSTIAIPVHAQCDIDTILSDRDKLAGLDLHYAMKCLGDAEDDSNVSRAVSADLTDIAAASGKPPAETLGNRTSEDLAILRNRMLELLALVEGSLAGKAGDMHGNWRSYAEIALSQMGAARSEISDFRSTMRAEYWARGQNYGFFEGSTTGAYLISYEDDILEACGLPVPSAECEDSVEAAIVLTRHIRLVQRILELDIRRRLEQIHTELVRLDDEWDYYFNSARSQYWWEFIANNAFYDPEPNRLSRPPAGQLILFHPSAAVERINDNDLTGSSSNLVGIIELIGYNRLRWKEAGPMSRWPMGLSAVATWAPGTAGDNFGYGLMLHVKNDYSIGVTNRNTGAGRETTWLLSVDLTKLYLKKTDQDRQWFRRLQ